MSSKKLAAVSWLSLLGSLQAGAASPTTAEGYCAVGRVLGIWHASESTLVVRVEPAFDPEVDACERTLRIEKYLPNVDRKVLLEEKFAEAPIAIWPLGERVLTLWESGSAMLVVVYDYADGHPTKVLEERPKGLPEIVFCADGRERIILAHGDEMSQSVDVFVWSRRDQYAMKTDVPWKTRLNDRLCRE